MSGEPLTSVHDDPHAPITTEQEAPSIARRIQGWLLTDSPWWLVSAAMHSFVFVALAFCGVRDLPMPIADSCELFADNVEQDPDEPPFASMELFGNRDIEPPPLDLTTDGLAASLESTTSSLDIVAGGRDQVSQDGGGTPHGLATRDALLSVGNHFDLKRLGPGSVVAGNFGSSGGWGHGRQPGAGGADGGFLSRADATRKKLGGATGFTKSGERTVTGSLGWLARHQLPDGHWSFSQYPSVCRDATCSGVGQMDADTAATALGLLPFFGAGQTHASKGPYRQQITSGLAWLMQHQKPDGDLRGGGNMYAHGLATIALCEAYGMTGDRAVGYAAQAAINFIQRAQNQKTGGWRYQPGEEGDTSVVGWQLMALKSGLMAGLKVDPAALEGVRRWLSSVGKEYGSRFSYRPEESVSPTMTSVGLLCAQYLGTRRDDPAMLAGRRYLMEHTPEQGERNIYYWYYATQVLHNLTGPDWDAWNRQMRHALIDTQSKDPNACCRGSWDPSKPIQDPWGRHGGRLMMTSLGALTLEVYYRYLPLYKLDHDDDHQPEAAER